MKKFVIQFVFLILIIFGALIYSSGKFPGFNSLTEQGQSKLKINETEIILEIADSADERKIGLGGREMLATDSGMLFVFEKQGKYGFWMKGVKFPLDMIWIREKKVVDIIKNALPPTPDQKEEDLPIYMPKENVDMVLEVNGGFSDSQRIKIGDIVELR